MPLMFVHSPEGTFDGPARDRVAEELTDLGRDCERLPATDFVRSTTWVYFHEYPPGTVYNGGQRSSTKIISLLVNVLDGGLDATAKEKFVDGATKILGLQSGAAGRVPAYVVVQDVPGMNWSLFGDTIDLKGLRNPPEDAEPI